MKILGEYSPDHPGVDQGTWLTKLRTIFCYTEGQGREATAIAIRRFKDPIAEAVFDSKRPKSFPSDLVTVTRRKLGYLDAAAVLDDLRAPTASKR